jgi:hypothetical protein
VETGVKSRNSEEYKEFLKEYLNEKTQTGQIKQEKEKENQSKREKNWVECKVLDSEGIWYTYDVDYEKNKKKTKEEKQDEINNQNQEEIQYEEINFFKNIGTELTEMEAKIQKDNKFRKIQRTRIWEGQNRELKKEWLPIEVYAYAYELEQKGFQPLEHFRESLGVYLELPMEEKSYVIPFGTWEIKKLNEYI